MPEFLAETYTSRETLSTAAQPAAQLAQAAAHADGPGAPARFLGAIAVPAEETCFYLYQAPTADAVHAAMTAAGLRPDRITPAIITRPPDPAPGTASQAGHPRRPPTRGEPPAARRPPARGAGDT